MNETRWTPGPWHHAGFTVYAMEGNAPGRYRRMDCRVQTDRCLASAVEQEANARLMAAAPDLYAIVQRYLGYHSGVARCESADEIQECSCSVCCEARCILARARGEEPTE